MAGATSEGSTASRGLALVAAIAGGAMVGGQGRINGELAIRTHSALEAAAACFVVGLTMLAFVMPFRRAGVARLRASRVAPWWCLGGLGGAFLVASSAHEVPKVGVAPVSVCLVAGTTAGAMLTDQFGLGPSGRHAASFWRFAGVAVVVVAVAISAVGDRQGSLGVLVIAVLFAAGASTAVQQAANGQLRRVADDVIVASFVSFVGGSITLIVLVVASGQLDVHSLPSAPWLYLGGPLGLAYILIGAATVRVLGVLRFVLGAVAGQLIASVVIDGVWPAPGTTLRLATVIAAVVTVIGVWLSGRDEAEQLVESATP
jgi:bacterial/archaeal transporter family-2 protein